MKYGKAVQLSTIHVYNLQLAMYTRTKNLVTLSYNLKSYLSGESIRMALDKTHVLVAQESSFWLAVVPHATTQQSTLCSPFWLVRELLLVPLRRCWDKHYQQNATTQEP